MPANKQEAHRQLVMSAQKFLVDYRKFKEAGGKTGMKKEARVQLLTLVKEIAKG